MADGPGTASITVHMAIEYPPLYSDKQNFFTTVATIKVEQEMASPNYKYIEKTVVDTNYYFMPPNSRYQLVTNQDDSVKLLYDDEPHR